MTLKRDLIKYVRDKAKSHKTEVYESAVTLCHMHHLKLHNIYGKRPKLITAEKQRNWVEIQRKKHGMV
jgi:hypothetical protein